VVTAAGQWRGWLPDRESPGGGQGTPAPPAGSDELHDALVAGFVPGIALGWSWADMIRHTVALVAATQPTGEVDLGRYEALLPDVLIDPAPG
jgi:hypothetical protein